MATLEACDICLNQVADGGTLEITAKHNGKTVKIFKGSVCKDMLERALSNLDRAVSKPVPRNPFGRAGNPDKPKPQPEAA